jgi:hypothetical protein
VNFAKYRERARLAAKNAREVEQGTNRGRMAHRRPPPTASDRRLPPVTDPSNANINSKSNGRTPSAFDLFWQTYPKKVKKKDALKVWQSKRLDPQVGALVLDVQTRLAQDKRWRAGFVCDPTTYLRGERWNDDIENDKTGPSTSNPFHPSNMV